MKQSKPTLDYSSPAQECQATQAAERQRRKPTEQYNLATFGQRRPLRSALRHAFTYVVIGGLLGVLLPRRLRWIVLLVMFLLFVWPMLRVGHVPTWRQLRRRWR